MLYTLYSLLQSATPYYKLYNTTSTIYYRGLQQGARGAVADAARAAPAADAGRRRRGVNGRPRPPGKRLRGGYLCIFMYYSNDSNSNEGS